MLHLDKGSLEVSPIKGFQKFFCTDSKKNAITSDNLDLCTKVMRDSFEKGIHNNDNYTKVIDFYTECKKNKKLSLPNTEKLARLERWIIGVERKILGQHNHYELEQNKQLLEKDSEKLLGTSQAFAEDNPDFVEFVLKNDLTDWFHRVNPAQALNQNENGPLLPFATMDFKGKSFTNLQLDDITSFEADWKTSKAELIKEGSLDPETYEMMGRQMTMWGLVQHHNYDWTEFKPITKVEAPGKPLVQVISYHPQKDLLPKMLGDQGHVGVIYIDKEGFVYSFGFFCPPPPIANFYAALKPQTSYIRSPDLYEKRHKASYQEIAQDMIAKDKEINWNYGALQFKFENDAEGMPCVAKVRQVWKEFKQQPVSEETKQLNKDLKKLIKNDGSAKKIKAKAHELYQRMVMIQPSLAQKPVMTAEEKFALMMERVVDLQKKTKEARANESWDNGALPYMLAEQNCAHVGRLYFGRWAEVFLEAKKDAEVVDSRPKLEGNNFLPRAYQSPFSKLGWAKAALSAHTLGRFARLLFITPYISTKIFGRGTAAKGIKPATSFWSCLKNFLLFKSSISPASVRAESMEVQAPIKSWVYRFIRKVSKPTSMLPQYR